MADQFHDSVPLVTNQITEDVADIAESLGYIKDVFQNNVRTWNDTVAGTVFVNKISDVSTTAVILQCKVVEIGDWDMDTFDNVSKTHGATATKIRHVSAIIRNDAGDTYYPVPYKSTDVYIDYYNATSVYFLRDDSGTFDSADFNSTGFNRGWIMIWYDAT